MLWSFQSPRLLLSPGPAPSRRALFAAMSLLPSRAARVPGPSSSLCALLALLLLTPPGPLVSGESAQHAGRRAERRAPASAAAAASRARGSVQGRACWGRAPPATCLISMSLFLPSWSCRGRSERTALHVFNRHTWDSSQNDQ